MTTKIMVMVAPLAAAAATVVVVLVLVILVSETAVTEVNNVIEKGIIEATSRFTLKETFKGCC